MKRAVIPIIVTSILLCGGFLSCTLGSGRSCENSHPDYDNMAVKDHRNTMEYKKGIFYPDNEQVNEILSGVGGSGSGSLSQNSDTGIRSGTVSRAQKEWTFMVYLDADNDLEGGGLDDFLEMSSVGSTADVNIIVQMDRIGKYDARFGDWANCERFYVTQGMKPKTANAVSDWGDGQGGREVNMADPSTLSDFLKWGISEYPANRYAAVLWDHGDHWYGVCWDDSSGDDCLNMSDLDTALDDVYLELGGNTLDILGFDACLMAGVEIAYQVSGYADYMVASEYLEPGDGWNYQWSLDSLVQTPMMSTSSFCRAIADDFVESYENAHYYKDDVTLSVVDFTFFDEFFSAFYNLSTELYFNFSHYQNYMNYAAAFVQIYEKLYIDLHHFYEIVNSTIGDETYRSLYREFDIRYDDIIEYERHWNRPKGVELANSTGLALYMPKKGKNYDGDYTKDPGFLFPGATYHPEFLHEHYNQPENTAPVIESFSPASTDITAHESENIHFQVECTDSEGNLITQYWYMDDECLDGENGNEFWFNTTSGDAGDYKISVYVVDGPWEGIELDLSLFDHTEWELTVLADHFPPEFLDIYLPLRFPEDMPLNVTVNLTDDQGVDTVLIDVEGEGNFSMIRGNDDVFFYILNISEPGNYNISLAARDTQGNWRNSRHEVEVADITPPVAAAPADLTIDQHTNMELNGTGSWDNNGVVNYTWIFEPEIAIPNLYGPAPSYVFHDAGVYNITLKVRDLWNNEGMDWILVTVVDTTPPVANAGSDIIIEQHGTVYFSGKVATDNVGIANYTWTFEYNGSVITLYGMKAEFNFNIAGNYNISLEVFDDKGLSSFDWIIVTVKDTTPPTADGGKDVTIGQGDSIFFNGSGSRDNVGIANYTWSFTYDQSQVMLYGPSPSFVFHEEGNYTVTLKVADAAGNLGADTLQVVVLWDSPNDDDDDSTGDDDPDDDSADDDDDGTGDDDDTDDEGEGIGSFLSSTVGIALLGGLGLLLAGLIVFFVYVGRRGDKQKGNESVETEEEKVEIITETEIPEITEEDLLDESDEEEE